MNFFSSWAMGSVVFGCVLGIAIVVGIVMNRHQIGATLVRIGRRLFSPVGFFGLVIVVFMMISVLESGQFFNDDITHGAIFGLLGYALALGFDLVSVVCMQARLNATRMRDERGARLNLVGVCICAAVSAFANVAGALQGYHPANLDRTPAWIQWCAPWTSMVFPALIVVLSMTTDHILDHTPASRINIDTFRARERKRVEMLQVRLETERELLTLDRELASLRHTREQVSGRVQREWIIWRWLRPVAPSSDEGEAERAAIMEQAMHTTFAPYKEQVEALNSDLHAWTQEAHELVHTLRSQMNTAERHNVHCVRTRKRVHAPEHAHASSNTPRVQRQDRRDSVSAQEEQERTATRILATFHHLGMTATDTEIARASGYSRTTVARWRKRLSAQGRLSPLTDVHQQ